ncbi:MAG: polysaccharide biosynthesis protein [Lactobacillaceae bacterium]|jgi:O-antigen/teichoic acid export membrane protein|nr:polysaccharide biosynthesis protein [Lactobacillaceae bacterium]
MDNSVQMTTEQPNTDSQNSQLVRGASWLAFGNIFSRILGALYIIPWTIVIGVNATKANGLFNMGYTIYALFLMIATAGLPSAISKLVAQFNAKNAQGTSLTLLTRGVKISIYAGILSAAFLLVFSDVLSAGNSSLRTILWSLSPALLILPLVAVLRGFFQGNNLMKYSAISQLLEQIARIIFILISTFIIIAQNPNNWRGAVISSTFAAFVGALVALAYLLFSFIQKRQVFFAQARSATNNERLPKKGFVINLLKQSLPFIIVGSAVTVFQLIDQYTYFPIMSHFWNLTQNSLLISFARFNANANKIIMIIVPLAGAISSAALPLVAQAAQNKNIQEIKNQVYNVFRLFFVVMMIAGLGLYGIAMPIYVVFYGSSDPNLINGQQILQVSSIFAIFYGFYSIATVIVQSVDRADEAMKALAYGLVVKILFQVPMIYLFKDFGPLMSSILGTGFSSIYLLRVLKNNYQVTLIDISTLIIKISLLSLASGLSALGISTLLNNYLPLTRSYQLITLIVSTFVGAVVAGILLFQLHVADDLLDRYLRRIFNRKGRINKTRYLR